MRLAAAAAKAARKYVRKFGRTVGGVTSIAATGELSSA